MLLGCYNIASVNLLHENNIHTLMFYFQKNCDNINRIEYSSHVCEPWQSIYCVFHSVQASGFRFENRFC